MKLMKKARRSNMASILPGEMLAEILRHAASNSPTDFVNVRQSCKAFLGATNDYQILENVSMEKLNPVPWRKSEKAFLKRCKDANNAEAFYRKGMIDFFSRRKAEGLQNLKNAIDKGHVEAIYSYGIILICLGGERKKQGLQILSYLKLKTSAKKSLIVASCRLKTQKLFSSMWVYLSLPKPKEEVGCQLCADIEITTRPNLLSSEEDLAWEASNILGCNNRPCCSSCFWDREAILFSTLLRNHLVKFSPLFFSFNDFVL